MINFKSSHLYPISSNLNSSNTYTNCNPHKLSNLDNTLKKGKPMAENQENMQIVQTTNHEVSELAMRFRKATLELQSGEELVSFDQDESETNEETYEGEWDF